MADRDEVQAMRQLAALRRLHSVSTALHSSVDLTATLSLIAEGVVETAGFQVCAVNLRQPDDSFEVVTVAGEIAGIDALLGSRDTIGTWNLLFELSERWGTNLRFLSHTHQLDESVVAWLPDTVASDEEDAWDPDDALFAPLTTPEGEWLGVISVDMPESGRRPDPWQLEILELFADHAAIAMMNTRLLEATAYAATHDPLTQLPNRVHLNDAAARHRPLGYAVLVIDLDGFKQVNDTYGHDAGDEVLVTVAQRMRAAVRHSDLVARTGGDEFVILLSDNDEATIRLVRQRLNDAFREPIAGRTGQHQVGASVGVARGEAADDFSTLLSAADADMYQHKSARNATT